MKVSASEPASPGGRVLDGVSSRIPRHRRTACRAVTPRWRRCC